MSRFSVRKLIGAIACALSLTLIAGIGHVSAQDGGLAKIKAAGVLRVGIAVDPPYHLSRGEW